MKYSAVFFALIICSTVNGQSITKRALFLGNSYTYVNNLPQMVEDAASSTGDILLFDSNTPGSYTLQGHSTNVTSLAKIAVGNWDYVVLQEQSQLPSFPDSQVQTDVFPYAHILDSLINADNQCAETVFYMTWGRKNGDASNCASWPPVCTYSGMDSLLNLRYRMIADSNNAVVSPVGAVWKYIRENFPLIDLYQTDESHPTVAGTYAAACCFYTSFFRKDPSLIIFNSSLSNSDAANIRAAAKLVVYDSLLNWHIGEYDPVANFTHSGSGVNQITFTNSSANATNYYWNFGDGDTSTSENPTHIYLTTGAYIVNLIAGKCGIFNSTSQTINITSSVGVNELIEDQTLIIYPNPVKQLLTINEHLPDNLTYRIFNLTGQEIQAGIIYNSEKQISVSTLPDGLYFLQLFNSNKSIDQKKFIKTAK